MTDPTMTDDEQLDNINDLYHDELFEEALIECDQLLASTHDIIIQAHVWRRIGDCKHQLKRYQEALEAYQRGLALRTGDSFTTSLIYLSQALTYQELHDFDKAQASFEKALELAVDSEDIEYIKEFWEEMLFDMEEKMTEAELAQRKKVVGGELKKAYRNLVKVGAPTKVSLDPLDWTGKPVLRA